MTKIISVGNITMGGTGKTPMVIRLGSFFIEHGKKVSVISRGYKGKLGYSLNVISDGEKIYYHPPMAADEPYLIANILKSASVITCKNRKVAVEYAIKHFSPDVILLDDAYHRNDVEKDLDILLLDYNNPIATGLPFPFGYLREFPNAIKRADLVLFTKTGGKKDIPDNVKKYVSGKPIFFSDLDFKGVYLNGTMINTQNLKFVAFSGIANNEQFFKFLYKNNINIVANKGFLDHHAYNDKDYEKLKKMFNSSSADYFITTEKDYVKLNEDMKKFTAYVKIDMKIYDEPSFFQFILSKCNLSLD